MDDSRRGFAACPSWINRISSSIYLVRPLYPQEQNKASENVGCRRDRGKIDI